ncbi:MAG: hypothetical protein H6R18_286 [Proteobacteria bacterium]|nr:hypothetical protein [Pseudomonadota bacterium]
MDDLDKALSHFDSMVDYEVAPVCPDGRKRSASACRKCLQKQYFPGGTVDYSCSQLRLLYVLCYLPVHLKENLDVLEGLNRNGVENSWAPSIEVLALGGGPGSEIAGFQIFVANHGFFGSNPAGIEITRLDRVAEWSEIFKTVRSIAQGTETKFKYSRIKDDVRKINRYKGTYDLVFLSYIVSELTDVEAVQLGKALANVIKKKCVLVFNDRNETDVVNRIDTITKLLPPAITEYESKSACHVGMPYPEAIKERVGPKLHLSSYRRGIVVVS